MRIFKLLIIFLLIVISSITFNSVAQDQKHTTVTKKESTFTREKALLILENAEERIKELPKDAAEGSFEAQLQGLLKKQISIIKELVSVFEQEKTLSPGSVDPSNERNLKQQKLESLSQKRASIGPYNPTQDEFIRLTNEMTLQREKVLGIKDTIRQNKKRIEDFPKEKEKAEKRGDEAKERIDILRDQILSERDEKENQLLEIQLTNAKIESQISSASLRYLKGKIDMIKEERHLLNVEMQIAEKKVELKEKELVIYGKVLEEKLKIERRKAEIDLQRKKTEEAKASTQQEKFVAYWKTKLAFSKNNKSTIDEQFIKQQRIFDKLDHHLQNENDKLQYLTNRLEKAGVSAIPANRIKWELHRLENLKKGLKKFLPPDYEDKVRQYETREFEVDDEFQNFAEIWNDKFTQASEGLSNKGLVYFKDKTSTLSDDYRNALNDEKETLSTYINLDQKIQRDLLELAEVLEEIELIVWASMFWIQDDEKFNINLFKRIPGEILQIGEATKKIRYSDISESLFWVLSSVNAKLNGALLFIVLPIILYFSRRILLKFIIKHNQKALKYGHRWQNKMTVILAAIGNSVTLPIYFYLASKIIGNSGLTKDVSNVLELLCFYLGIFFLFYFLTRAFFGKHGIAIIQFGLNKESSRVICKTFEIFFIAFITLRLCSSIGEKVFAIYVIPQLLSLAERIIQGVAVWYALRRSSILVKNEILSKPYTFLARYWTLISGFIFFVILAVWGLEITGYRYAAIEFSKSLYRSIIVAAMLPLFYRLAIQSIENVALRRRRLSKIEAANEEDEKDKKEEETLLTGQAKSFVRVFFYLVGAIIITKLWGLDSRSFKTLDEVVVYYTGNTLGEKEIVSVADLFLFLLIILVTVWFLRNLRGITEYVIFSRLRLDEGVKYAILTISRYTLFCISTVFALSVIHLSLARLGWLVAAMGVGLGFGLQEIVSNFVSGIILLLERPIRVNDFVTVGNNIGVVTRINIRATTITNFDRQELIVPNRMLITQEVTNWTRGDNIIRLIVPIGVAYGSDTKKVTELLLSIAKKQPDVLNDPEPNVFFISHGESSLDFELRVYLSSPIVKMPVLDNINKDINSEFAKNDITIPFPQRDIHIIKPD